MQMGCDTEMFSSFEADSTFLHTNNNTDWTAGDDMKNGESIPKYIALRRDEWTDKENRILRGKDDGKEQIEKTCDCEVLNVTKS